ncbi:heme A synthase [Flavobacterium qiangtangense]|uniref:Heme A synthase n=1 Tax=Flavobacterium qiangtangense TaxID=1442595 RepID=A0ABW1PS19_9FLAO
MKKYFPSITKTALILVYLVIVAGAVVRMSGSGMGCPDWPKCFGYYIPPTDISELTWTPNRDFEKGQVIIRGEKLLVAQDNFNSGKTFDESHWQTYTKHDYASFNPTHTWVEYINRLFGALAGLACFAMAIASFSYWKQNKKITLPSWLVVFMMGFQAWLGATVVYSVLNPVKITVHMVMALVIVCVILYILHLAKPKINTSLKFDKVFDSVMIISLILTLTQIILGTQVRQYVDEQVKIVGYDGMAKILEDPIIGFYFHRTFSFVVLAINVILITRNRKLQLGFKKINWVLWLLAIEILSGISMYWYDFPFGSQTIHLVIASLLFGTQFYLILESKQAEKRIV